MTRRPISAAGYIQHRDGDTVVLPQDRPYRMACCGCDLVHDLHASITDDGDIALQVFRNDRETERLRQLTGKT
jgi:hypothetical protein